MYATRPDPLHNYGYAFFVLGRPAGRFSAEHIGRPQHVFFVTLPSGPSGCLGQGHARALVRPMKKMWVLRQVLPRAVARGLIRTVCRG